ncbi:MAG: hypothetical protein A2039_07675 [Candidatus Melainabacteria bacterium GWA2_34_9]|nr:MAG: hypothetical protein A2039_07675 [Candidatus Melainabacteria bacterium GWA2_34_9]
MSKELKKYVETALLQGLSKEQIKENLTNVGWPKSLIDKILSNFSGLDSCGLIIPAPKQQFNQIVKDIFVYSIVFITLTMSSFAAGTLLFKFVDYLFKDYLTQSKYSSMAVSWAISQLIVAFPVYAFLSLHIVKDLIKNPEKRESLIRKMMIYLILLITAITGITDLTSVLSNFFRGELSLNSFLDASVVFVIAMLIFSYYLHEMKQDDLFIKGKKL